MMVAVWRSSRGCLIEARVLKASPVLACRSRNGITSHHTWHETVAGFFCHKPNRSAMFRVAERLIP